MLPIRLKLMLQSEGVFQVATRTVLLDAVPMIGSWVVDDDAEWCVQDVTFCLPPSSSIEVRLGASVFSLEEIVMERNRLLSRGWLVL